MHPVSPDAVVRGLEWRYATQKFDRSRPIDPAAWDALERSLVLTPSSFGLQPWTFVVVDDPALRARLVDASWGQMQIVEAPKVVVFAARTGLDAADAERYVRRALDVRGLAPEVLDGFKKTLVRFVSQPKEKYDVDAWAVRQVYIALGQFMTAAALLGVDTCPMEGISPAKYDDILGLPPRRLRTAVVCCAGHRAADDPDAALKKIRFERDEVIVRM
jgi:nitroreductase